MNLKAIFAASALLAVSAPMISAQESNRGFYKDVFMDSGIRVTSRKDLPTARSLGYSMEAFISAPADFTIIDTILQNEVFAGSAVDENGHLLYPDGAPRFRVVYMNGGRATRHGRSLGEEGRQHYRDYIKAGGSYVGTCAGAYCASTGYEEHDTLAFQQYYIRIWPGWTEDTDLSTSETDMTVPKKSPLNKYYDWGNNKTIENVYHNGGCFGSERFSWPKGTEVLARFKTTGRKDVKAIVDGKPSIWAWKENGETGRVICCGSHPEGKVTGENFYLMRAMLEYAMEGNGAPRVKAALKDGESRLMDKMTHENAPEYTRIGDKQYHHYTYDVPKGCDSLVVKLESVKGWKNFDLYLYANSGDFAFSDNAWWRDVTLGVDKTLVIKAPKKGKLYISVFCDTTVEAEQTAYGEQYKGRLEVLNGVPYKITVNPKEETPAK
ncbi:MAG: BPL-N domain-containing protein [Bacteroidales bacterium]|nr:BPL-N domain-containing protein [Bacteroidales bacterium]